MKLGVLYISYDGMLEPLGQSQVLAYLTKLANDHRIHLISYEKKDDWAVTADVKRVTALIAAAGIVWHPLKYHKSPSALATSWDIFNGFLIGYWLVLHYKLNIVHARSYVPSVIALALKRLTGAKYLFDMRGFWADEKVDGGTWLPNGLMYRTAKRFERRFLIAADHVVSLTNAGVRELDRFDYLKGRLPPITVIPTCADLTHFSPLLLKTEKLFDDSFVLGYIGSVGTFYMFDEVILCFSQLLKLKPNARLLILNRGQHQFIKERLLLGGIPNTLVHIISASYSEVPSLIGRMDAGIFFIKPTFSKLASAPTKLAELLGCGIPCLGNTGVGDLAEVIEGEQVGVAIAAFDTESLKNGLEKLLSMVSNDKTQERCVDVARRHFSLKEGVANYSNIYKILGNLSKSERNA